MTPSALSVFALLIVTTPPAAPPPTAAALIEKLFASGRRQSEPISWALLDAYEQAPDETLRAAAQALVRRCDNSVTEEALQRILKQDPAAAAAQLDANAPLNTCVVRAIDALNRHPRINAAVGAPILITALDSAERKVRLAALDALTAPAFANDTKALALIQSSPSLAKQMDHIDDEIRFRGTAVSVSLANDAAHPRLSQLLSFRQSRSLSIRQRTQEILAQFGRPELSADFGDITECVGSFRAIAKQNSAEAEKRIRKVYGDAVAYALQSENAYCRIFAFEQIGRWTDWPDICANVSRSMHKEKVESVRVAMRGACFQRSASGRDEKWLAEVLKRSPSRFQKLIAARALLRNPARGRPIVIASLKDPDRDTRWIAAQSFADERVRWEQLHASHAAHPTGATTQRDVAIFYDTMEKLVPVLADPDWYVRNNAALALQEATGHDFGTHAKRWRAWWESAGRKMWGQTSANGKPAPQR